MFPQGYWPRAYWPEGSWPKGLVEAAAAGTLGALTVTATGTVAIGGATAGTLGALTVTATGTVAVSGTASQTLGALTGSAEGTVTGEAVVVEVSTEAGRPGDPMAVRLTGLLEAPPAEIHGQAVLQLQARGRLASTAGAVRGAGDLVIRYTLPEMSAPALRRAQGWAVTAPPGTRVVVLDPEDADEALVALVGR